MQVLTYPTTDEAAEFIAQKIMTAIKEFKPTEEKKFFVLGLPTGSTPLPVYQRFKEAFKRGEISFQNVVTFNMDEYVGLDENHEQSYHRFMYDNLFNEIDIPQNQIHILNGVAEDLEEECISYEAKIKSFGGIDIQLGGIGENGHIAFNEPDTPFDVRTHVQVLTDNTIEVNARFFEKKEDVPTKALSIGLGTIFDAREVIILATGEKKAEAVRKATTEEVSLSCPASMLQNHKNAWIICDEKAGIKA
ncbi:MAG: glucosamine-6-phosphate deaminase [Alphaproteobacteria bacterium]|nr:glucosamine-6-phosphate deaminase [Alphaproteobacteria bacterium]